MIAAAMLTGAYLVGSIPFGLFIVWAFTGRDIRASGSGNIGATNARRTAGNPAGVMTLVADMAKGALPVMVAMSHDGLSGLLGGAFPAGYPVAVVETVNRIPQDPFADVTAKPAAALDQVREVMLIWSSTEPQTDEEPDDE